MALVTQLCVSLAAPWGVVSHFGVPSVSPQVSPRCRVPLGSIRECGKTAPLEPVLNLGASYEEMKNKRSVAARPLEKWL